MTYFGTLRGIVLYRFNVSIRVMLNYFRQKTTSTPKAGMNKLGLRYSNINEEQVGLYKEIFWTKHCNILRYDMNKKITAV